MTNSEWKETSLGLLKKYSRLFTNRQVLVIADFIEQVSEKPDDFNISGLGMPVDWAGGRNSKRQI